MATTAPPNDTYQESTLRLRWPVGQTLGLALFILVFSVILAELAARTELVQSFLPTPDLGTSTEMIGLEIFLLEKFVEREGVVDCIFLGTSTVYAGINPEVFQETYKARTGDDIRCFNVGVGGLSLSTAAVLAEILVAKYQPKLLIVEAITISDKGQQVWEDLMASTPWFQYHLGEPSLNGWLAEHSYAYRYFLRFRVWMEQPKLSDGINYYEANLSSHGYSASHDTLENIALLPDRHKEAEQFEIADSDTEFSSQDFIALNRMLQLQPQVTVILLEVPMHATALAYWDQNLTDRRQMMTPIYKWARHHQMFVAPTPAPDLIPDEGWRDRLHMNDVGATIFGKWLGAQIGEAVNRGLLPDPTSHPYSK